MAVFAMLSVCDFAAAQETGVDPDRVFITELHWDRVAGAPHSEKLRYGGGTLVILYLDGLYAEVRASFIKAGKKTPVGLNLNEGYIVRLGTWSRTEDDVLIRTQSREVVREKLVRDESCKKTMSGGVCSPVPEKPLPGPLMSNTCRLEHPSPTLIADVIVCSGLTVFHPQHPVNLNDYPSIVRQLVEKQNRGLGPSAR